MVETINLNNTHSYNEILEALRDLTNNGLSEGFKTGINDLDESFRLDKGMLCTVTGIPNHGKSEFTDFLCTQLNKNYGFKTLFFSAEDCLKIHLNKLIDKYNFDSSVKIEDKARFLTDNYTFIDYDKVYTVESLFEVAENEITTKPFDIMVIDPFNKLEAQKDYNVNMTDYISKFLDRLLRFTKKHNVITLLVAHPRKMSNDMIPSAYDIADSAHFFNKSDYCITVHADKAKFTTLIRVDKVKYKHLGYGGEVILTYDDRTGNFYTVDPSKPIYNETEDTPYSIPKFVPQPHKEPTKDYLDIEIDWFKNITETTPKQKNLKEFLTLNNNVNGNVILGNLKDLPPTSKEYTEQKKQLPNFCINARFNGNRASNNIKELTGLMYIDIDYKDNTEIINDIPTILKSISSVAFYKHSCSGKGYFAIIPYNTALRFDEVWHSLNNDFATLGVKVDPSTKNPDRVTFYSNDPDYWINPCVEVYNKSMQVAKTPTHHENGTYKHRKTSNNTSANKKYMEGLITFLEENKETLETNYHEWEQVCLALISEFKETGLKYFLEVSKHYSSYNETEATDFYNEHLDRYEDNNTVSFGTIRHYAEQVGYKG